MTNNTMNAEQFQQLPTAEVAHLVRSAGEKVCVFPLNGTRRWFILTHGAEAQADFATAYLERTTERNVALCRLLFEHGLTTVLTPVFSTYLMQRGEKYVQMAAEGLSYIARHPAFLQMYAELGVRVRFYGDYKACFANTPYAFVIEAFEEVMATTAVHTRFQLLWGVCAQDATSATIQLTGDYYEENGRLPDKQALIQQYYGLPLPPVDIYIGSGKPRAFDMPLITTGREDLYFTVTPSLALNQVQLRHILYDHLYARAKTDASYDAMQPQDWQELHQFYQANQYHVLGVGAKRKAWGLWYPRPQVVLDF